MAIEVYDLLPLERKKSSSQELKDTLKACRSSITVINDLEEAMKYVDLWNSVVTEAAMIYGPFNWDAEEPTKMMAAALMRSAIVTFCRAVDRGSKGRSHLDIDGLMQDPMYAEAKVQISKIRNNGVGHYGPADRNHHNTTVDGMVLLIDTENQKVRITSPYEVVFSSQGVMNDLRFVIGRTHEAAIVWRDEVFNHARKLVKDHSEGNQIALLKEHPLDLNNFHPETQASFTDRERGIWYEVPNI